MGSNIAAFADTMREIVGGFSGKQMIAIGVVFLVTLALGFMIGALSMYAAGIRKGRGQKKITAREIKQMEKDLRAEKELALAEADKKNQALLAERDADVAALKETKERLEKMEKTSRDTEEEVKRLREREQAATPVVKTKINALTKAEILEFAQGLGEHLPVNVIDRGGENLPVSCRVGICTFMLVYEMNNMVKVVLRLHDSTVKGLKMKTYKLFSKAVFPKGGEWYRWILSDQTDTTYLEAAIRMAYKYTYLSNYDKKTGAIDVDYVNAEEAKINEEILKYRNLPDRDFIVASGATEGADYQLYGKKEMANFVRTLASDYPIAVNDTKDENQPATCKVADKPFLLAYEKDGVSKIIFRVSEEEFETVRKKHPKTEVSAFPKSALYSWYVTNIDESFRSNKDIEELIRMACAHVHSLYS